MKLLFFIEIEKP